MIENDGDIIRGIGFVSLFSAWVEDDVNNLLKLLAPITNFDDKMQKWVISKKLKYCARLIRQIDSSELKGYPEVLEKGIELLERRNKIIHGRLFRRICDMYLFKPGRPKETIITVSSLEVYSLANELCDYRQSLLGPQYETIPNVVTQCNTNPT